MKLLAKHRLIDFLSVVLIFCALCAIWEAIILVFRIPRFILPSPWEVVLALISRRDSLLNALRITSSAVLLGLLASVLAGMIIAIVFAQSHWIRRMLYPYTILLQTVPIVAISPLIVMWAGPGTVSVSLITFIICLAPIIANATQGSLAWTRTWSAFLRCITHLLPNASGNFDCRTPSLLCLSGFVFRVESQ
jgi:NitT/TauT family transport system permease protein